MSAPAVVLDQDNALANTLAAFERLTTACGDASQRAKELCGSRYSRYCKERHGTLIAVDRREDIDALLEMPRVIHACVAGDRWDGALSLYEQTRAWQQQVTHSTRQEDHISTASTGATTLISRVHRAAAEHIEGELIRRLIARLSATAALPELARHLGQLRRAWHPMSASQETAFVEEDMHTQSVSADDALIHCPTESALLSAFLMRARISWWRRAVDRQGDGRAAAAAVAAAATAHSKDAELDAAMPWRETEPTSPEQLAQWLDALRLHTPELHRQLAALLAPHGAQAEPYRNLAAAYVASTLRSELQHVLQNTNDLTFVATLATSVADTSGPLARCATDVHTVIQHDIHLAIVRIATGRAERATVALTEELQHNTAWLPAKAETARLLEVVNAAAAAKNVHASDDAEQPTSMAPPEDLMQAAPFARLLNSWLALLNDLRWYAPIGVLPSLSAVLARELCRSSDTLRTVLQARESTSLESVVVGLFVHVLAPYMWQCLQRVFACSSNGAPPPGWTAAHKAAQHQQLESKHKMTAILSAWLREMCTGPSTQE
ncbi:hypothetical protein THASP1DRAFT_30849 [Thamnocephalis sphaerospora]|uniref:Conserved oligomeric Golgi complex subunit 8 n=1 Tax=Thamnocephalis sphaerospora TaxID=78915 RepID=A0A4P9XND2_9FUNG|nr:hypothetical protein THASP1DRAFT_30849 [Thamnocephalis sphaerospora]|eukprot:RKP07332.1 hypothetical protein THASP1DRAFT_30849 [Thamnocephalis sphaerospora]